MMTQLDVNAELCNFRLLLLFKLRFIDVCFKYHLHVSVIKVLTLMTDTCK